MFSKLGKRLFRVHLDPVFTVCRYQLGDTLGSFLFSLMVPIEVPIHEHFLRAQKLQPSKDAQSYAHLWLQDLRLRLAWLMLFLPLWGRLSSEPMAV